jgi:hypothetical protein
MKTTRLLVLAALLSAAGLRAQTPMSPRSGATTHDLVAEISYAGSSDIREGTVRLGEISTTQVRALAVTAIPLDAQNQFLIGLGAQQLEFDPPAASLVPSRLGSLALKLGWNHALTEQWSFRAEIDPGTYGAGSFGAPVAVRAIYAASRELQWAFGVNYDGRSGHPLVGGVGVRWQFAPDWTLAFLLPAPRVEWAVTKTFSLSAGASLRGGTFRVADDFGRARGRPLFDRQNVGYREINVGIGGRWQLSPGTALYLGVGQMTDRRFEFDDRNLLLNGDGAPSAQLTLTSAF